MPGLDLSSVAKVVEGLVLLDTLQFAWPGSGQPVFNETTGLYEYPNPEPVWEGSGAVVPAGTPGGISALPIPTQPWVDETRSKYRALTPLAAPVAERGMLVTVLQIHAGGDLALIGRQWRVQDPSMAGTLVAVRVTALDQVQQTREAW